jgi:hypothetical protein
MAKIRCYCNTVLSTSGEIPNPIEWKLLSDVEFDRFEGMVDAEDIYRAAKSMFRCPTCGRLWVYWDGLDRQPVCYERHDQSTSRQDLPESRVTP